MARAIAFQNGRIPLMATLRVNQTIRKATALAAALQMLSIGRTSIALHLAFGHPLPEGEGTKLISSDSRKLLTKRRGEIWSAMARAIAFQNGRIPSMATLRVKSDD